MAPALTFKSVIYFEFIFVTCKVVVQFHSLPCDCPAFLASFIEEPVFFTLYILGSFIVISSTVCAFFTGLSVLLR